MELSLTPPPLTHTPLMAILLGFPTKHLVGFLDPIVSRFPPQLFYCRLAQ